MLYPFWPNWPKTQWTPVRALRRLEPGPRHRRPQLRLAQRTHKPLHRFVAAFVPPPAQLLEQQPCRVAHLRRALPLPQIRRMRRQQRVLPRRPLIRPPATAAGTAGRSCDQDPAREQPLGSMPPPPPDDAPPPTAPLPASRPPRALAARGRSSRLSSTSRTSPQQVGRGFHRDEPAVGQSVRPARERRSAFPRRCRSRASPKSRPAHPCLNPDDRHRQRSIVSIRPLLQDERARLAADRAGEVLDGDVCRARGLGRHHLTLGRADRLERSLRTSG